MRLQLDQGAWAAVWYKELHKHRDSHSPRGREPRSTVHKDNAGGRTWSPRTWKLARLEVNPFYLEEVLLFLPGQEPSPNLEDNRQRESTGSLLLVPDHVPPPWAGGSIRIHSSCKGIIGRGLPGGGGTLHAPRQWSQDSPGAEQHWSGCSHRSCDVPASGEPLRLHPTTAKWLQPQPPLRAGQCRACGEWCSRRPQGPPEVADTPISGQPGRKEEQRQHPVGFAGPPPGPGRLLRPLHTVVSVL
ncbi:myoD family inhibitor isoform X3 [Mesocricetus auratus]|uniref:MyoD family inhibitor isoform X3 n=1 Tax=Mesocricetus auratus TaxID=10036 RepID=A0A1U8BT85_MESAU|nr:myoD family inhibitor isoform X3 [Mesocricetus auratus]